VKHDARHRRGARSGDLVDLGDSRRRRGGDRGIEDAVSCHRRCQGQRACSTRAAPSPPAAPRPGLTKPGPDPARNALTRPRGQRRVALHRPPHVVSRRMTPAESWPPLRSTEGPALGGERQTPPVVGDAGLRGPVASPAIGPADGSNRGGGAPSPRGAARAAPAAADPGPATPARPSRGRQAQRPRSDQPVSSTSRTVRDRASGRKGFSSTGLPSRSRPDRPMRASEYAEM